MRGRAGRPNHIADELCPREGCNRSGFRYIDIVRKDGDVYYYSKFSHTDPTIADHVIQGWQPLERDLIRHDRIAGRTTVFGMKGARSSKVWNVVIFHLKESDERIPNFVGRCYRCYGPCTDIHDIRCDVCNRTTIHWCPKCLVHSDFSRKVSPIKMTYPNRQIVVDELEKFKIPILKLNDLVWFSKTKTKRTKRMAIRANHFLSNLLNMLEDSDNLIITYGDLNLNEAHRISELFDCDATYLTDQSGVLKQFKKASG